jgi:hypothetical protein
LSSDLLQLYLAPDTVQAVQLRGWRKRIVGLQQVSVKAQAADDWQAVLEATLRLVATLKPQRVRLVLSDQLARYFCFAWRAELRNEAEEAGFARLQFDDIYGADSSAAWRLMFSNEAPGQSRLVAAMPEALLAGLQSGLAAMNVTLASVRPHLVCAVQAMAGALPKTGWIMSHEAGRLSIAGWGVNGWQWVSSSRVASDAPERLLVRLQQELTLAGAWPTAVDAPIALAVCAPLWAAHPWPATPGLQITPWKLPPALIDRVVKKTGEPAVTLATLAGVSHALLGVLS